MRVLVKAFNDLGYVEGKNIHLDHRFPAENPERFRILARELVKKWWLLWGKERQTLNADYRMRFEECHSSDWL
jgi:hypothetical protein